jgi:phosphatidylinositol alpha-1,6-mannosyltransferase
MRILIATPDFPLWDGGIATVAYEMALGLNRLGHAISVMAPMQTDADPKFDSTLPCEVIRIKNVKDHYVKPYYHSYRLGRILKSGAFDLVMSQSWYPSGIAACAAAGRHKIRTSVTVHGNEILSPRFKGRYWQKKLKRVFSETELIFCVSSCTAEKLYGIVGESVREKVRVVNNGVDPETFTPAPPDPALVKRYGLADKTILLTLARLVERKGHDMVIRAFKEIKRVIPASKYIICGKGSYEGELKRLAESLGLADDVIFTGFVPNEERVKYYNLSNLYLMPSREIAEKGDMEGFGITFLEANACEKPVIGGASGGISEAIVDGETGSIADPLDVDDITRKALKYLQDPELSKRTGEAGRRRVINEFNWGAICATIDSHIRR